MRSAAILTVLLALLIPGTGRAAEQVDLALVFAVDVSYSMDYVEQRLQRGGYVNALRDPDVIRAIKGGLHGRIAVTYVEWAGVVTQKVVIPWTIIDGSESANRVADTLATAPISRLRRTSIAGALMYSLKLFDELPFEARRRVIDVSGDGPNNDGPHIEGPRDDVLSRGITINGLPLLIYRGERGYLDLPNLDQYYEDCVIGGPGAFIVPVIGPEAFTKATRTKLILEISDIGGEARVQPAFSTSPRVPCDIGEQMMRRWNAQ